MRCAAAVESSLSDEPYRPGGSLDKTLAYPSSSSVSTSQDSTERTSERGMWVKASSPPPPRVGVAFRSSRGLIGLQPSGNPSTVVEQQRPEAHLAEFGPGSVWVEDDHFDRDSWA
jgi:hypothetical protein